jgi:hypothetical protein
MTKSRDDASEIDYLFSEHDLRQILEHQLKTINDKVIAVPKESSKRRPTSKSPRRSRLNWSSSRSSSTRVKSQSTCAT